MPPKIDSKSAKPGSKNIDRTGLTQRTSLTSNELRNDNDVSTIESSKINITLTDLQKLIHQEVTNSITALVTNIVTRFDDFESQLKVQ